MQRSSVLFLLLAAVVAIAVGLMLYSGGAEGPEPDPPPAGDAPAEVPHDPGHEPDPAPAAPTGRPMVRVEVHDEATFVPPPPPPRVFARAAGTGAPLPLTVLAGEGAGPVVQPSRPGTALVAIAAEPGREVIRQVEIVDAAPTEYRLGARVVVRGRVLGERWPVRGAEVWLGELDATGARRTVTTDAEGAFEFDTPDGPGVPFVVTAEDMAVHGRLLTVGPGGLELEVKLVAGMRLELQLAAAAPADVATARVFVVPTDIVSTALAQYPFFLQALTDGYAVNENGRAIVTNLPTDGRLGVLVRHARLVGAAPTPVTLRAASQRLIVPVQFVARSLAAPVVDGLGAPLADVSVWSRRAGQELVVPPSARLLPPSLPVRGACRAWTDAEGRFVVGTLADAAAVVSLRAPGFAGLDLPATAVPATAPIVLPAWTGGEPSFRLQPPAPGVVWHAASDLGGGVQATVAADQPWVVSFPHAGRFTIVLSTTVDGVERGRVTLAAVDVTGPIELQAPRLP